MKGEKNGVDETITIYDIVMRKWVMLTMFFT